MKTNEELNKNELNEINGGCINCDIVIIRLPIPFPFPPGSPGPTFPTPDDYPIWW